MGKFMHRAFITACYACESSQTTLRKIGSLTICDRCLKTLIASRVVTVKRGRKHSGSLKMAPNTRNIIYEPLKEIKDLDEDD